jgi:hypothetical protein
MNVWRGTVRVYVLLSVGWLAAGYGLLLFLRWVVRGFVPPTPPAKGPQVNNSV